MEYMVEVIPKFENNPTAEEFEKYYQKQLWRAVEGCRKQLGEATDNFAQFEDYRWRKI